MDQDKSEKKTFPNDFILHIADAFVQSNLQLFIYPHTDGGGCRARCRPAHQEQFGVQYLAQGNIDMQIRGI